MESLVTFIHNNDSNQTSLHRLSVPFVWPIAFKWSSYTNLPAQSISRHTRPPIPHSCIITLFGKHNITDIPNLADTAGTEMNTNTRKPTNEIPNKIQWNTVPVRHEWRYHTTSSDITHSRERLRWSIDIQHQKSLYKHLADLIRNRNVMSLNVQLRAHYNQGKSKSHDVWCIIPTVQTLRLHRRH
jgi:hypothetical protein